MNEQIDKMEKKSFFYKLWNFIILNGKWGAGGSVGSEWSRKKWERDQKNIFKKLEKRMNSCKFQWLHRIIIIIGFSCCVTYIHYAALRFDREFIISHYVSTHDDIICNYMTIALLAIKWSNSSHPSKSPNSIHRKALETIATTECRMSIAWEGSECRCRVWVSRVCGCTCKPLNHITNRTTDLNYEREGKKWP